MMRPWWLSLLLLTIPVALADSTSASNSKVLKSFKYINTSNVNVKQCVWFAMQEYNKGSEDKYIFLVANILHAQLQIKDRLEYLIDVRISRSNCKKPVNNTEICVIQENPKLKKKISCSFLVGALPWYGDFTLLKKRCEDV